MSITSATDGSAVLRALPQPERELTTAELAAKVLRKEAKEACGDVSLTRLLTLQVMMLAVADLLAPDPEPGFVGLFPLDVVQ